MTVSHLELYGLPIVVALVVALVPCAAIAQDVAAAQDAASAPGPLAKPARRLMTPEQTRDSATVPGDLRPERPVTPQIKVPFGKAPPAPSVSDARARPRSGAAPAAGIDDTAARCEAQDSDSVRAACRAKLAREAKGRPPS